MIHHPRMGTVVKRVLTSFPSLLLAATIQPITRTVLRVRLLITPDFEWDDRIHGTASEPWWLWVEDSENNTMYHSEYFLLQKKQVSFIFLPSRSSSLSLPFPPGGSRRGAGTSICNPNNRAPISPIHRQGYLRPLAGCRGNRCHIIQTSHTPRDPSSAHQTSRSSPSPRHGVEER